MDLHGFLFSEDNYLCYNCSAVHADVVKLVYTRALGARAFGREGSSPFIRTKAKRPAKAGRFALVLIDRGLEPIGVN